MSESPSNRRYTSGLRIARAMLATNLKACWADRAAFFVQMLFMMLNNFIFVAIWYLFFLEFEEVRGWRLPELLCLYGTVAAAFGASIILSGGVRELARMVVDGDLDSCLVQPQHPLMSVTLSRTYASGWGDLLSGFLLVAISGNVSPTEIGLFALFAISGATIFTATSVILHSLAFWLGPVQEMARAGAIFLQSLSVYPQTIFGGYWKIMLFTAVPSGFIGYLPVTLYQEFHWPTALGLVAATAGYAGIAYSVFELGLRRYESGNRIGRAAG